MKLIKWSNVAQLGEPWHLTRAVCRSNAPIIMHYHDFAEVFWIEDGQGSHCLNGERSTVDAGTLVFIRPQDRHEFRCDRDGTPFTLANFSLPASSAADYHQRWKICGIPRIPWGDKAEAWHLSSTQLAILGSIARAALDGPCTPLAADRFLSGLMHEIHREPTAVSMSPEAPEWLYRAVAFLNDPERLQAGVDGFFQLAGRSREHVARVCQRYLRMTPTELVNKSRLEHAARLLERTDMTILEIGSASGFTNPSLFHRRFRTAFECSPLQYRRQRRSSLPSSYQVEP